MRQKNYDFFPHKILELLDGIAPAIAFSPPKLKPYTALVCIHYC